MFELISQKTINLPIGYKMAGIHCGIKKSKKDLGVIYSVEKANAAAVFTTNKVKAAPVLLSMKNIENNEIQAIIVNSGNANACTGEKGYSDSLEMASKTALALDILPEDVFVCSTGVIGMPLDMEKIVSGITKISQILSTGSEKNDDLLNFANAIMTTDTFPKVYSKEVLIHGKKITIVGIAKGSGMIHPNMATMLSFILTDANIEKSALNKALKNSVNDSYNMISVDGDTSTNDTVVILANKKAANKEIFEDTEEFYIFCEALNEVNTALAKMIVKDGEGATKFLEVEVTGAKTVEDAKLISRTVIKSNLVKTAFFGEDANWGRIIAAAGYSGANFDPGNVYIYLENKVGKINVCQNGHFINFSEEKAKEILKEKEIKILINLREGKEKAVSWGCDMSYDYIKINGGYRS
ncbi:ornithine acetyltransferase [Petrotoga sp. 9PWA.NaAc.5.4]|nr:bifunctional glutamate N-acetyltransferase/amino-acid acetyltransferase ArgJ [Petrotoga sp. 9PWA.NaAc.5.4]PNR92773.1 ornithine acetyltransferase [Petrotoga sp. 9PWA.NaAc.5.4]